MKQNVSNRIFKILFILFLFALGVNLLSYAIEVMFGLELYCFSATSFTVHFALWAVCCICGPTALLLHARRMAIAALLSVIFWAICLGVMWGMIFWPETVHHSMTPYASPSGEHHLYIAYEGMVFKQKNLLFVEKVREISYPSGFLRECAFSCYIQTYAALQYLSVPDKNEGISWNGRGGTSQRRIYRKPPYNTALQGTAQRTGKIQNRFLYRPTRR